MRQEPIVFLHGLQSGPNGNKARWLAQRYRALTPELDTSAAIRARDEAVRQGRRWVHGNYDEAESFRIPLQRAREAIAEHRPRLVVGSSFGGAVLLKLVHERLWQGPCLFLAGAGPKLTAHRSLPDRTRAILVHGRFDDVVPLEDSRALVANAGPGVQLWEVGDGHMLASILADGTLELAVDWLLGPPAHDDASR